MVTAKSTIRWGQSSQGKKCSLFTNSHSPASMQAYNTANKLARLYQFVCPTNWSGNGVHQRNGFLCWWRSADHGKRSSNSARTVQDTRRCAAISLAVPSPHKQLSVLSLLYPDGKLDGLLFETCYSEKYGEKSAFGTIKEPAQVSFALLLGESFHGI